MSSPPIRIQVQPAFLPEQSSPQERRYAFSYTVTIRNEGSQPVQLISRHWIIDDGTGQRREVKGLGVVGKQPLIGPGQSFVYTSGCQLPSPGGTMHGSFFFVTERGDRVDVAIPLFVLETHAGDQPRVLH